MTLRRGARSSIFALDVAAGSECWVRAWEFYCRAGIDARTVREHTMWTLFTGEEIEDAARRDNEANAHREPPETPPEPPIEWIH